MSAETSNLCPHGHDRRTVYCVRCDDPARVTAAASGPVGVIFGKVMPSESDLLKTQVGPTLNGMELESLRWSPYAIQFLISQYTAYEAEVAAIGEPGREPITKALESRRSVLEVWRDELLVKLIEQSGPAPAARPGAEASASSTAALLAELERLRAANEAQQREIDRLRDIECRLDAAICLHLSVDPDGPGDCTDRLLSAVEIAGKSLQETYEN